MGAKRKGRPRIAPEVMEARGSYKAHPERRNEAAPKANGNEPQMPDYFTEDEQWKWIELVEDLQQMGILSTDTRELMIAYCTAYGGWMKARKAVETTGVVLVQKNDNGKTVIKRNPFSAELHKYRDEMNRLLPEFGLTPSSRGKLISLKAVEEADPFGILSARYGMN